MIIALKNSDEYKAHLPNMPIYAKEAAKRGLPLNQFLIENIWIDDVVAEILVDTWDPKNPVEFETTQELDRNDTNPTKSIKIAAIYLIIAGGVSALLPLAFQPMPYFQALPRAIKIGTHVREYTINIIFLISGIGILAKQVWARKMALIILIINAFYCANNWAWGWSNGPPSPTTRVFSFLPAVLWNGLWFYMIYKVKPIALRGNQVSTAEVNETQANDTLRGVQGWLKLFVIINMYISPLLFIIGVPLAVLSGIYKGNVVLALIDLAPTLFFTVKWILIARHLRAIAPGVIHTVKRWLLINLFWVCIPGNLLLLLWKGDITPGGIIGFNVFNITWFALWFTYFKVSKRVKTTYAVNV